MIAINDKSESKTNIITRSINPILVFEDFIIIYFHFMKYRGRKYLNRQAYLMILVIRPGDLKKFIIS